MWWKITTVRIIGQTARLSYIYYVGSRDCVEAFAEQHLVSYTIEKL